ncbi:MAG: RraA family protein [Henriciella sp.]|nr:RraA family protein [Henriciella sp.]
MSDANVGRAKQLDVATLSDALDKLEIAGQCLGIKPLDPSFQLAGRAFTVTYGPASKPVGTVGDFIDDVPAGHICVLDNGGREDATVWGDIMTLVANKTGIGGTVIDGACRDTALARELGYPMYSRSYSMRTGKDRVQFEGIGKTVNIGDARVQPGDLMRGDADGVVAIPAALEDQVLEVAETIHAAETRIRDGVLSGKSLAEVRKEQAYHLLQRKGDS